MTPELTERIKTCKQTIIDNPTAHVMTIPLLDDCAAEIDRLRAQLQTARENCALLIEQNTVAEALAVERFDQLTRVRAVLVKVIQIAKSGATDVTRSKRIVALCDEYYGYSIGDLRKLDAPEE